MMSIGAPRTPVRRTLAPAMGMWIPGMEPLRTIVAKISEKYDDAREIFIYLGKGKTLAYKVKEEGEYEEFEESETVIAIIRGEEVLQIGPHLPEASALSAIEHRSVPVPSENSEDPARTIGQSSSAPSADLQSVPVVPSVPSVPLHQTLLKCVIGGISHNGSNLYYVWFPVQPGEQRKASFADKIIYWKGESLKLAMWIELTISETEMKKMFADKINGIIHPTNLEIIPPVIQFLIGEYSRLQTSITNAHLVKHGKTARGTTLYYDPNVGPISDRYGHCEAVQERSVRISIIRAKPSEPDEPSWFIMYCEYTINNFHAVKSRMPSCIYSPGVGEIVDEGNLFARMESTRHYSATVRHVRPAIPTNPPLLLISIQET